MGEDPDLFRTDLLQVYTYSQLLADMFEKGASSAVFPSDHPKKPLSASEPAHPGPKRRAHERE
jgi:hypothetical protein